MWIRVFEWFQDEQSRVTGLEIHSEVFEGCEVSIRLAVDNMASSWSSILLIKSQIHSSDPFECAGIGLKLHVQLLVIAVEKGCGHVEMMSVIGGDGPDGS